MDAEAPRCTLLSNGTYCLAVTEAGQSFARWHALSVCRRGTRSDPAAAAGRAARDRQRVTGRCCRARPMGAVALHGARGAVHHRATADVTAVQTLHRTRAAPTARCAR
ncbi:MAG: hypothetical protein ACLUNO_07765 [Oscillospiraceae bacterium]